jgi:amidohydrolase family protein
METALAAARLILGRILERFDLTICLAHGGGCLPTVLGRLDMGWRNKEIAHTTADPPSTYARRLYYDTAVFSQVLLPRLVRDMGADHVLLGTDHPFDLRDVEPLEAVHQPEHHLPSALDGALERHVREPEPARQARSPPGLRIPQPAEPAAPGPHRLHPRIPPSVTHSDHRKDANGKPDDNPIPVNVEGPIMLGRWICC